MKKTGKKKPNLVTYGIRICKYLNINIEPHQLENGDWSWEQISLTPGRLDFNEIVTKLIFLKYTESEMMEIVNNYLDKSSTGKYFIMQAWKSEAKKIATEAIQYAKDNNLLEGINEQEI